MKAVEPDVMAVQREHADRIRRLFDGERLEHVPVIGRLDQREYLDGPGSLASWMEASVAALESGIEAALNPVTFRPFMIEFWPLGVHFVDTLFGAEVYPAGDNFWTNPLPCGLADLTPVDLAADPMTAWAMEALAILTTDLPPQVQLATPVFSSPLNIAVNILGERALTDLSAPGPGELRGMQAIADAIASLHEATRRRFPGSRVRFYASSGRYAPDGFGHVCGCTTQLVGPDTYARYVGPLDAQVLGVYPEGGTIHLCGYHTQHIPCWRAMENLRGVQLNDAAADDFEAYFHGLRDDQIIYIAPTAAMPIARILDLSGGRRVILQALLDEPVPTRR